MKGEVKCLPKLIYSIRRHHYVLIIEKTDKKKRNAQQLKKFGFQQNLIIFQYNSKGNNRRNF